MAGPLCFTLDVNMHYEERENEFKSVKAKTDSISYIVLGPAKKRFISSRYTLPYIYVR